MRFGPTDFRDFGGDILVRCPRCAVCAHLIELALEADRRPAGYRLICATCCLDRDWILKRDRVIPVPSMGPRLRGFGVELWLQAPCRGETLWAFNEPHVDFLERFISARLRERHAPGSGWCRNTSLEGRLPRWMQVARNREAVLKSMGLLREKMK